MLTIIKSITIPQLLHEDPATGTETKEHEEELPLPKYGEDLLADTSAIDLEVIKPYFVTVHTFFLHLVASDATCCGC